MDRPSKPMTALPQPGVVKDDDSGLMFDVDSLLDKAGAILAREVRNLAMLSARGKLEPADARDLVAYIRLLSEIQKKQEEEAANLTDEELVKHGG